MDEEEEAEKIWKRKGNRRMRICGRDHQIVKSGRHARGTEAHRGVYLSLLHIPLHPQNF